MSILFTSENGISSRFFKKTAAEINGATSAATAVLLGITEKNSKMIWFDNTTNVDISIFVQKAGTDTSNPVYRPLLIELPANRPINFNRETFCEFPPKTIIWVAKVDSSAATSGHIRMFCWGI